MGGGKEGRRAGVGWGAGLQRGPDRGAQWGLETRWGLPGAPPTSFPPRSWRRGLPPQKTGPSWSRGLLPLVGWPSQEHPPCSAAWAALPHVHPDLPPARPVSPPASAGLPRLAQWPWDLAVPRAWASHAWTCCLLGQMPSPGSTHLTPPPPAPSSCPCWEPAAPDFPWAEGLGTAAAPWTPGSQPPLSFEMHPGETSGPPACLWLAFSHQAHCPGLSPGSRARQSRDVSALGPSERTRWSGHLANCKG